MRILHVYKTYYPDSWGGIEQVIRQLALKTTGMGMENRVLTFSREAKRKPTVVCDGVTVVRAPVTAEIASTPLSLSAMGIFKAEIAAADVIHYHFPYPFADVLHLLSRTKKASVVTYHSDVVRQRHLMRIYGPLMRRFLGAVDAIVPTSPNYLNSSPVLKQYRAKATVIPLGIDDASFATAEDGAKQKWLKLVGKNFLFFVGVLRYYKGLHTLLHAATMCDAKIVIAGDGPESIWLKKLADELQLKNVYFAGAISEADKAALLELCRGIVFPSHLRSEAFGISLLEGAAFGKALISCEIGTGTSFINLHGKTGIVVPPEDAAALADAMNRLIANPDLSREYGEMARLRYRELFTADIMAHSYMRLYQDVFKGKSGNGMTHAA